MPDESGKQSVGGNSEQTSSVSKSKRSYDFQPTEVTILTEIAPPYSRGIPYLNRQSTNRVTSYQFSSEKANQHEHGITDLPNLAFETGSSISKPSAEESDVLQDKPSQQETEKR